MNTNTARSPQSEFAPPMRVLRLQVKFLTPAFLGDAEQNGRWRTPPFKAQLRQWWRVAYAADHNFNGNLNQMRREEGLLFGNAWLSHLEGKRDVANHSKSLVRLRLQRWDKGMLASWDNLEQGTVFHPETTKTGHKVGPHAYLAYGPLDARGGTKLAKANAAIQAAESANFFVAWPETFPVDLRDALSRNGAPPIWPEQIDARIRRALWLMDRYGAVGGRSRNGWGSYGLLPCDGTPALQGQVPLRDWRQCLNLDWPHAIGRDEKGELIWQTEPHADWKALMKTLAVIKIGLRTQFRFATGRGAPAPEARHWLSYPVTNHDVRAWGQLRLPNQLRFKVREENGQLVGKIFHMPHLPPRALGPNRAAIEEVWRCVHQFLDALTKPVAERGYCALADQAALAEQKAQLGSIMLKRVTA